MKLTHKNVKESYNQLKRHEGELRKNKSSNDSLDSRLDQSLKTSRESIQTKSQHKKSLRDRSQVWRIILVEISYFISFVLRLGNVLTPFFGFDKNYDEDFSWTTQVRT